MAQKESTHRVVVDDLNNQLSLGLGSSATNCKSYLVIRSVALFSKLTRFDHLTHQIISFINSKTRSLISPVLNIPRK